MPDSLPTDGLVIVAKRDCPTCVLVEPVMQSLDRAGPLDRGQPGRSDLPAGRALGDRRPGTRALVPPQDRGRADPDPLQGRPRGRAHRGLGAQRMAAARRRRRRRRGPAGLAAGLRLQERRARRAGGADRALRRDRPEVARDRRRQLGRSDRSLLRARLERRPAGGAADRRAHPAHAGRHRAQARRDRRASSRPTSRPAPSRRWRSTR